MIVGDLARSKAALTTGNQISSDYVNHRPVIEVGTHPRISW